MNIYIYYANEEIDVFWDIMIALTCCVEEDSVWGDGLELVLLNHHLHADDKLIICEDQQVLNPSSATHWTCYRLDGEVTKPS